MNSDLKTCHACPLWETATQAVPGEGPMPAEWMFVAEAPGATEDSKGRPLIGEAGQFFDQLLRIAGLKREDVYVTNVVKHRPPGNRPPKKDEIVACAHWFWEEFDVVQPKVVVAMGLPALSLFKPKARLASEHGLGQTIKEGVVLIPWYHPAAALHKPNLKPLLIADAQRLQGSRKVIQPLEARYELIDQEEAAHRLLAVGRQEIGFDTETTSPERGGVFQTDEARVIGYSFSTEHGSGFFTSTLGDKGGTSDGQNDRRPASTTVFVGTRGVLESSWWTKVCHNAKFEYKVLKKEGITLREFHDTKLSAYLLGESSTHLKDLTQQRLGVTPIRYEDVVQKSIQYVDKRGVLKTKKIILPISEQPPEDVYQYAAADADHTLRLWQEYLRPQLEAEGLWRIYSLVELPLVPVLAEMEMLGVKVDVERCEALKIELEAEEAKSVATFAAIPRVPMGFNLASTDQLSALLKSMGAPIKKRTPIKGQLVTGDDELRAARRWNPALIDAVLDYRKFTKLKSYVENFLELKDVNDVIHTSFNQAGSWEEAGGGGRSAPRTGRLSSSGPNLQNIPHHSDEEWGRRIRSVFVARSGRVLLAADVKQEEPRIIARVADDATLRESFKDGLDIYRPATMAIYGHIPQREQLNDEEFAQQFAHERFIGKTFFLAWYYGADVKTLMALDAGLTPRRAKEAIQRLVEAHPARQSYIASISQTLNSQGYVLTLLGRKIWCPKVFSSKEWERAEGIRGGANGIIQGTAADVLKVALRRIHNGLETDYKSRLLLHIHDEVILEAVEEEVPSLKRLIQGAFQVIPDLYLPIEFKVGKNLGEMH